MASQQTVLITGGSGLVGQHLSQRLLSAGYRVTHLSRKRKQGAIPTYQWDINRGTIDDEALQEADHIIHLAGAGIADKRWTAGRKQEIVDSRVQSAALLGERLQTVPHQVKSFISASAIGYYGDRGSEVLTEDSHPGQGGFLERVCLAWEESTDQIAALGIRTVKLRIGVVLAKEGGALPKVVLPMRFGVAPYFGSGRQYYSWIHIDDLTRLFMYALETRLSGPFNAVAPHSLTNKEFTKGIRSGLGTSALLLPAPAIALRLAMGQMADAVLYSANVSADKILQEGFSFSYPEITPAVAALYR